MSGARGITLVGRDAPLWLAAAALRRALGPAGVAVRAVELPAEAGAADLYPTLPAIEALHNQIGIDEAALLRNTRGAFTLGQNFVDASGAGRPSFLHSYGAHGTAIDGGDFFPHWVRARHHGLGVGLDDFSLTASAALGGRLFFPDTDSEVYGRSDYGYHLPAAAYAKSLQAIARHLGVELFEAANITVERGDGIAALLLDDGRRIESALFADLTRERLLSGGDGFEAWDTPGDRVLRALAPRPAALPAYAEIRASEGGWTGLFPSLTHIHIQHVFSHALTTDEAALKAAEKIVGLPLGGVTIRPFAAGVAAEPWGGNVIALGDAACVFDPVHGFALHGLQLAIVHLLAAYPADGAGYEARRAEYNRVLRSHFARVADFQTAHHALQRYSGAFWDAARALPVPDELTHRIDLFTARGELPPLEDESLPPDSWRALLVGHGIIPQSWRPAADRLPPEEVKAHFRKMLGFVREAVLRQPTHDACLARILQPAHD
ncbi:tryptophan halogenase [Sphingopyxis italica]|uniref:Tryptophan halogenase n=1 Tax=Sphingopyxis italica TaxID=1129133 RepID=A0A7X6BA05_9SPHN|nr:tryptophan 7-halogenase [Sphingopyxis italica]NJB90616.1 tryptophan halogenase [Sphingopyxis italica]